MNHILRKALTNRNLSVLLNRFTVLFCNQSPHRQRHIPHRHDQALGQNENNDRTTDNEVQCKQGDSSAQEVATPHAPEAYPMEAKQQIVEYPEPYIVNLSVLHAGGFENTIQDQRHEHGQYTFEEKCFDYLASCHW